MANTVISNTFKTYESVGNREDLTDVIYNIAPTDTPLLSNAGRATAEATYHEWQQDSLADAASNAQLEGLNMTEFTQVTPTVRVGNYVQISTKDVIVSGTQEAISKAGRKSELAYQTAKRGAELKRDMEKIALDNQAAAAGSASVARKTGSVVAFIKTNTEKGATGADPDYTSAPTSARTDGTQRAFTEDLLKSAIQKQWAQGGKCDTLLVGAYNKTVASKFEGIATSTFNMSRAQASVIIGAADVYVSDFGVITIVPDRFMRARDALLLDFDLIDIMYLRSFRRIPLAKTGDADKRMLLVEWGVKVHQEAGLAGVFDLTTAAS